MDPVTIIGLVGTLAGLIRTVNGAVTEYQQWLAKRGTALSKLKDIENECITTRVVAESAKRIIDQTPGRTSDEQKRLFGILESNIKELERLVTSLDRSIRLIFGHKNPNKIRSVIVAKEEFLTAKLRRIRDKRELVDLVTRALTSNDIREMKTHVAWITSQFSLARTGAKTNDEKSRKLMEELAQERRAGVIERLFEEGADPNFLTIDFSPPGHPKAVTPLLCAMQEYCYEAVDILLSNGAMPNLVVGDEPPLWQAFAGGHIDIATRLLDAGADIEYPCVKGAGRRLLGTTVFSEDFADRKLELVELALEYGANKDVKAPNGNTPLHDAVELRKGIEIVDMLLRAYATVDSRARDDLTPLMMAAYIGDQDVTDLLVENGADPSLRSKDGLTAAEIARRENHVDLAAKLDTFSW